MSIRRESEWHEPSSKPSSVQLVVGVCLMLAANHLLQVLYRRMLDQRLIIQILNKNCRTWS